MVRGLITSTTIVLLLICSTAAQFPDPSDPELEEPPPPGGFKTFPRPVLIEDPCRLLVADDSNGMPVLTVIPSTEKPVPMTYTIRADDTAMYITLRVIRSDKVTAPPQPRVELPSDSFRVYVEYEDAPDEQAIFLLSNKARQWTIQAIKETGFVELGERDEKSIEEEGE